MRGRVHSTFSPPFVVTSRPHTRHRCRPQKRASLRVVSPEGSSRLDATAASLMASVNESENAVLSGPIIEARLPRRAIYSGTARATGDEGRTDGTNRVDAAAILRSVHAH